MSALILTMTTGGLILSGPTAVLRSPMEQSFALSDELKKVLARYIRTQLPRLIPIKTIVAALPDTLLRAGKVRVLGEKESICGEWAASRQSKDKRRDSSFVRVRLAILMPQRSTNNLPQLELLVPTQTEDGLHDIVKCFYAQLHYIVKAVLPVHDTLGIQEEFRGLLALVSICDASGDATRSQVWYSKLKKPQFVHVGTIQCVVGRVKVENRWGIIDTSIEGKRTSSIDADDASALDSAL